MSLIRLRPRHMLGDWDSFGTDIRKLRHEMDRLFSRLMVPGSDIEPGETTFPSAELQDKGESFTLNLEVPGMKPKDLDIQVSDDSVSIKGERRATERIEEDEMTRSEFRYGMFSRTISLPQAVKSDEVVASYNNGILSLVMPKQDKEMHKAVKVEVKST